MFRRISTGVCAAALVSGVVAIAAGSPAGAQDFNGTTCHAHVTGTVTLDIDVQQDLSANATAPTEADSGSDFTVTIKGGDTDLPSTSNGLTVGTYQDLSTKYHVSGANIVAGSAVAAGVPTINGTNTVGTANISGNDITTGIPGPIPPGALHTPDVSFKVHAGAVGSTVTVSLAAINTTANLPAITSSAAVTCPIPANTLATTQVVAPPPPGAPDAVADVATTNHDQAVTIDVLQNDVPNQAAPIDQDSLVITDDPSHGTATINADHTVTYTPAAGFNGTDDFTYQICSPQEEVPEIKQIQEAACDTAVVTVTVLAPPPAKTTTTLKASGDTTPPTTVQAAANELPRTGSSTGLLLFVGSALVAIGAFALRGARWWRRA
jgi:LPXTG-motif cell wall-anchored protein